jgi:two-component system chemotaxis response regulator CheB
VAAVTKALSGGLEAVDTLVAQLPSNLPASIFIIQHVAPETTGIALLQRPGKYRSFQAKLAEDGEIFKPSRIYIAPPDFLMLVKADRLLVT